MADLMPADNKGIRSFAIQIGDTRLSGLRADGGGNAGLILALHGGGYDARYWHSTPQLSLLEAGCALGFSVVAVNRPGYCSSSDARVEGYTLEEQAGILFNLVDSLRTECDTPVFLIGHSMGGILAIIMAAHPRAAALAGVDVSGVPLRYPQDMQAVIDRAMAGAQAQHNRAVPTLSKDARRQMFYGENGSFDPFIGDISHPVPPAEMVGAYRAPIDLPPQMVRITLPVQWTIAAHERSSVGGEAMLEEIRAALPQAATVRTAIQSASGHNISLHHVGRAYHLRALAFFEECRALRPVPHMPPRKDIYDCGSRP